MFTDRSFWSPVRSIIFNFYLKIISLTITLSNSADFTNQKIQEERPRINLHIALRGHPNMVELHCLQLLPIQIYTADLRSCHRVEAKVTIYVKVAGKIQMIPTQDIQDLIQVIIELNLKKVWCRLGDDKLVMLNFMYLSFVIHVMTCA